MLKLVDILSVLSKSSPYAVTTESNKNSESELDRVKRYLYVKTPVEHAVSIELDKLTHGIRRVIFVCGSSGDGKSEILTRSKTKYENLASFHLDATHSFSPHENAIQTLDRVFGTYDQQNIPLVVGINTGMLGNYAQEGANERIKLAIEAYLDSGTQNSEVVFINFEDFPKFTLDHSEFRVEFAESILNKLTDDSPTNPFFESFEAAKRDVSSEHEKRLIANFKLLCLPAVKNAIIGLLFKARVYKDQFLTARALLDFIYEILTGPGYLMDNLFEGVENEIGQKLNDFDPANIRTREVDRFILAANLGIHDVDFEIFESDIVAKLKLDLSRSESGTQSYLRLFYLFMHKDFSNNYHHKFNNDFSDTELDEYLKLYRLHSKVAEDESRFVIRGFYNKQLRPALRSYNNRVGRKLEKGQYLISDADGFAVAAKLDIKFDRSELLNAIERNKNKASNISHFEAFLSVDGKPKSIPINANLFKLISKINDGYRPNRHDKNAIILLDELNDSIAEIANQSETLQIISDGKIYSVDRVDEDDFEVSGF